jgi:hypothetical protein
MSNTTNDETPDSATASRAAGSLEHRLARLLDTPLVAKIVPRLAPETLHQLIQYRGLEACGELVTSATPAQLASLLDLTCGGPPAPDVTKSSMSLASANGSRCWWTRGAPWPHAP